MFLKEQSSDVAVESDTISSTVDSFQPHTATEPTALPQMALLSNFSEQLLCNAIQGKAVGSFAQSMCLLPWHNHSSQANVKRKRQIPGSLRRKERDIVDKTFFTNPLPVRSLRCSETCMHVVSTDEILQLQQQMKTHK